ncbi:MAG TPA: hypothetical protein VFB50_05415 [Chloroflexota bacterium]|nr:hypothetical protein [Chloroflexota bacterium]
MTKPSEGGNFSIAIEERFDPSDDHIVELMSMDEYNGISTIDGKPFTSIMWHCRIFDEHGVAFCNEIDQGPYDFVEFSSMSLAKGSRGPAKARLWASAFLGHELSDEECERIAENFDGTLVGKRALASWSLADDPKNGGKKLKWALLRPIPARMRRPAAEANGSSPVAPVAQPAPTPSRRAQVEAEMEREPKNPPFPAYRETASQRRARLQAELASMDNEDDPDEVDVSGADDDPFN